VVYVDVDEGFDAIQQHQQHRFLFVYAWFLTRIVSKLAEKFQYLLPLRQSYGLRIVLDSSLQVAVLQNDEKVVHNRKLPVTNEASACVLFA
jgi:hypothetical protein